MTANNEWQPIETAPKNDQMIYGINMEHDLQSKLIWNGQVGMWEEVDSRGRPMGVGFMPTRYFNIPNPPKEQS